MPTKTGKTFAGTCEQCGQMPFLLTKLTPMVSTGDQPRFTGCKSVVLTNELQLHQVDM